jgi:uncharacterized membrane protein YfcA
MEALLIFAVTGAAAGVLAGLFGVGGGLIMVPALAFLLPHQGVGPDIVMQVAIGTSLAVIGLTSISSTIAHHRRGGVLWEAFTLLAPGLALGAVLGAVTAHALPGLVLQRIVGIGAILVAIQMFLELQPAEKRVRSFIPGSPDPASSPGKIDLTLFFGGAVIGALSSLIGIGGGSLTVPFLSWRGVEMRKAVGTAAACGVPISWAGAMGMAGAGWDAEGLPDFALGYISVTAFAGLAAASVLTAPLGARLAHRLPPRVLKRAFAGLLVVVGATLLLG